MSGLLPVEEALARILENAAPLGSETVAIGEAAGRVLAEGVVAARAQPPFPASAMDGYAVRASDIAAPPATLTLIGASIAGKRFHGHVGPGEAVRIFTGAPVPEGADTILIQEDAQGGDGTVTAMSAVETGRHIRSAGCDFNAGETVLAQGRAVDAAALSLAAATGRATLDVVRRPRVAILSTGSELVPAGIVPGPDQIVASNAYGVAALIRDAGGEALDFGIVADEEDTLRAAIRDAHASGADIVVTLGGAALGAEGMTPGFWRIAMRPGKPLLFGRLGAVRVLGLPGNPVSSLVCTHVFLKPLVAVLAGLPPPGNLRDGVLTAPMKANDHRQDYVRAEVVREGERLLATPFARQDSSMLSTLAAANALIVRAPRAPAAEAGDPCRVLMLR
jgi:molybdopterin molybdotransferase